MSEEPGQALKPTIAAAFPVWVKIGLLSFGGPAGQIALMQDEIVTRRGWVTDASFQRGLSFSLMLPGPEAQQLATWLGWRLGGHLGGVIAGLCFIVPGALGMIFLAWIAALHGRVDWVSAIFTGVQPVVIALVLAAMSKIAKRALKMRRHWIFAFAAFALIWWGGISFPIVVALAAVAGLCLSDELPENTDVMGRAVASSIGNLLATTLVAVVLCVSVYVLGQGLDHNKVYGDVAALFTTAALVTFGGAYAVLPYVAGEAVSVGWLDAAQMLNGLAIAEATPGPLILVNTYAGFFAGWSTGATVGVAIYAAGLATFYTFVPSFALILGFAPMVERLHEIRLVRKALAGISAAVVGVIANLILFLGEAAFVPSGAVDAAKVILFLAALVLVFGLRVGMLPLVVFGILAGLLLHVIGLLQ